ARAGRSAIRAAYPIAEVPSGIRRSEDAAEVLHSCRDRAWAIELGGDLFFAGTESLVREVSRLDDAVEILLLDVRRVDEVSSIGYTMLGRLRDQLARDGRAVVLVDPAGMVSGRIEGVSSFTTRV